jgi:truncated hemoglobin YjbI
MIAEILGGPKFYKGRPIMSLHEHLNITTAEFDILMNFVEQACSEMDVAVPIAKEVR